MKILQLVQKPQMRGAEMFASQLSTHINTLGHEAQLVFIYPGEAPLPFSGKKHHIYGHSKKKFFDIAAWKRLAAIIKAEKPDIIQANAGDTLKYAVFSKLIFRWKQPIVFRNASTISLYIKSSSAKLLNGFFFSFCKKIISVSHLSAKDFKALYPKFTNRTVVIPVGIDSIEKLQSDEKLTGEPAILHVGGFSFEKNHSELISIFELFLRTYPKAQLHLVGDGPLKNSIEKLVNEKNLEACVHFYGFRKDAPVFMQKADCLVLPSVIEGLPGVILEAFACSLPVVANDVGGIHEIVRNKETGFLVAKGDINAFCEAMVQQVASPNALMKEKALNLVNNEYQNNKIAEKFIIEYRNLL